MTKAKSGITFPPPKGKQGNTFAAQDPRKRPQAAPPRVVPRTKASAKGR
jgi:hypothetical protein